MGFAMDRIGWSVVVIVLFHRLGSLLWLLLLGLFCVWILCSMLGMVCGRMSIWLCRSQLRIARLLILLLCTHTCSYPQF